MKIEKSLELFIVIIGAIGIFMVLVLLSQPTQIENDVKNGTKTLSCEFSDGWRDVPKEKIMGLNDETGYWYFTNGSARNCEIY